MTHVALPVTRSLAGLVWARALRQVARLPVAGWLALSAGLVAAAAWSALSPEGAVPAALRAAGRIGAAAALLALLADLIWRLLFPLEPAPVDGLSDTPAVPPAAGALDGGWLGLRHAHPRVLALGGLVLLTVTLMRSPPRLTANVLAYVLVGVPLLWVSQLRGGAPAAKRAALALALFALVPTHTNVPDPPALIGAEPGSVHLWPAGWPAAEWALRHEIELERPLTRTHDVVLHLAAPYIGGARVLARLNGRELGAFRSAAPEFLTLELPAEAAGGETRLRIELRVSTPDPALRVAAHRWTAGSSLGLGASSYFDGIQWHPGTFDDVQGRPVPGIYAIEVQPRG